MTPSGGEARGDLDISKNLGAALSFINYATSPTAQKKFLVVSSLPAVVSGVYADLDVEKGQPFRGTEDCSSLT